MKKIIFCWELGGNYGHITSFLPFYRELLSNGIEVDFVLRDITYAHTLLGELNVRYFQAPFIKVFDDAANTYTYTDILAQSGYLDADSLTAAVSSWRNLIGVTGADLIIADHAPTAILAARTIGLPVAMFGGGFVVPPLHNPMPLFHVWSGVPDEVAHKNEANVLTCINSTLTYFQKPVINSVCEIFDVDARFLCAIPELDHYLEREGDDYWGPNYIDDIGLEPEWPDENGPRLFAYLTAKIKTLDVLLSDLAKIPGSKLIHIPKASTAIIEKFSDNVDMTIVADPVKMREVLLTADVVIHQAGAATTAACLLAGVRQVLIPTQLEQRMLCKKLASQGLALGVDADVQFPKYEQVIKEALQNVRLGETVKKVKDAYHGFDQKEQYVAMANVVNEILSEAENRV